MPKKKTSAPAAPARKPRNARSKAAKLDLAQAGTAVKYANELTVESLVANMGALQTSVQGSLASLSAQLTGKLSESQQLDLAIAEKQRRFQELTEKEAEAVTLDELKLEIETTKVQWARETEERTREHGLDMDRLSEEQTRLIDQYKFANEQAEHRWKVEFIAKQQDAERAASVKQQELERGWAQREEAIKAQETEIAEMRTAVAGHQAAMDAAVAKAVEAAQSSLNTSHTHALAIVRRESESAVSLAKQELVAAQKALALEQARNTDLEKRAQDAERRTLEVVQSALNVQAANSRADAVANVAQSSTGRGGK
jgi:colicin import membrane protein